MPTVTQAQLISLIRDDLINYKLVSSLNDLGLNAQDYFLHLSETIFELMGFNETGSDAEFENYLQQLKKVKKLTVKSSPAIDQLAVSIYKDLLAKAPVNGTNKRIDQ